jgi:hypothetical protein
MGDETAEDTGRASRVLQDEVDQARREAAEVHEQLEACRQFAAAQADRNVREHERAVEARARLDALAAEHEAATARLAQLEGELADVTAQLTAIRRSRSYRYARAASRAVGRLKKVLGSG